MKTKPDFAAVQKPETMEPLALLSKNCPFEAFEISRLVSGKKYTAIMLKNGNIGVCANLGIEVIPEIKNYHEIELTHPPHRIVLNAFLNAKLNNEHHLKPGIEIFDYIDFKQEPGNIMLGQFRPLLQKFRAQNIPVHVVDPGINGDFNTALVKNQQVISGAAKLILTSTSIANQTFLQSIKAVNDRCEIMMLGPSSVMSHHMASYRGIKMIFGTLFEKYDHRVLNIISNDGGTRDFQKFGYKTMFEPQKI